MLYDIYRVYQDIERKKRLIKRDLTLEEARAFCERSDGSSRTAKGPSARNATKTCGPWFHAMYPQD